MFFWTHHHAGRDNYGDEPDVVGEPLELETPVILVGDPDQVIYALGNVANGAEIRVVESFPPEIMVGPTQSIEYRFAVGNGVLAPPSAAEKFLFLVLSREERQTLIGDLAEEWHEIKDLHGIGFANTWYWEQTLLSILPLLSKALRWSVMAGIGEWIRRFIR
jgi:hypothetical protein